MKPALTLVNTTRSSLREELGIVSNIPIPKPPHRKAWRQLQACEVGDSFLTKSLRVYEIARELGIQIKVDSRGRVQGRNGKKSSGYYRVWKIGDGPCA